MHEGLEFLASEQANGSPGGAVTTQESDMETEEATREGRRLPPSREEGAHECRDIPEGPHEGERELSEACEESGTTSQPCLVPRSNSGVTVSGSDSAAGSRAADPVTEEDASVVPEWALNYLVNRNYTSVADVWKEWAHGQDGYPISLRRMEELWGTRWRRGRLNEGKRISKFRKLTRMVESVIEQHDGISEAAAVQAVENTMVASGVDADQPWKYCELLQESQAGNPNEPSEEPSKQSGKRRTSQESGSKKKRQKAVA